jgi:hypothetical protein
MSQLGLFTGNVRDALAATEVAAAPAPSTFYRANLPRYGLYDDASDTGSVSLVTQVMTAVPIKLAAGDVITNISFQSGATAAGTPTNWWFALYDERGDAGAARADRRPAHRRLGRVHGPDQGAGHRPDHRHDRRLLGRDHGQGHHGPDPARRPGREAHRHRRAEPVRVVRVGADHHGPGHPGHPHGEELRPVRRPHLMHRRRLADRGELVELLAVREPAVDWPAALDALEAAGARVEIAVTAEEEAPPWQTSS